MVPVIEYNEQRKFVEEISILNNKIDKYEQEILKLNEDMDKNLKIICE